MPHSSVLELRARRIRANAAVRSWEYRQRHHAKGTWFRLRRLLTDARECWKIAGTEAAKLLAEGYTPEPVGHELEPRKTILVLSRGRLEAIADREQIRVSLSAAFLAADCLVLIPFE